MAITVIEWKDGNPWPDKVMVDGVIMEYAHKTQHTAHGLAVIFTEPGKITEHWIYKSKLDKLRKA